MIIITYNLQYVFAGYYINNERHTEVIMFTTIYIHYTQNWSLNIYTEVQRSSCIWWYTYTEVIMFTMIYIHYTQKWSCLQWYIFTEVIIYTLARAPRWPQQASNAHLGKDAQPIQNSHHFPRIWQETRLSKGKPSFLNYFCAKCSYFWALLNLRLFDQIAANTEVLVQPTYLSIF